MIYLINASKVWLLCIVHTNLSIYGKKKSFHVKNCPRGTVGPKIGHVSGTLTIQANITAMRYRSDVIWSVLLLHIRANLSMMLVRDYASCHAAISTLVMLVANMQKLRWPANSLYLNPIDHMLDLLKHKVRAQPL